MDFRLELCVDTIESAIIAQEAGADRVELCDNLNEGGTTPGPGKILSAKYNLSIDLNVLVRPRPSDFLYSDDEYDIMRRDIEFCGEAGISGIVLGILKTDGCIDTDRTMRLAELAGSMSLTFHRAFDMCADPYSGMEDIINSGAKRILTSGQKNSAFEGIDLIASLVKKAGKRIIIMPGGGINEENILEIATRSGSNEFHMTLRQETESEMRFRKNGIYMGNPRYGDEYLRRIAGKSRIENVISILKAI